MWERDGRGEGLFAFFYCLMSSYRESGKRHLLEVHPESLRGSRHIFQQRTFQLDVRKKNSFSVFAKPFAQRFFWKLPLWRHYKLNWRRTGLTHTNLYFGPALGRRLDQTTSVGSFLPSWLFFSNLAVEPVSEIWLDRRNVFIMFMFPFHTFYLFFSFLFILHLWHLWYSTVGKNTFLDLSKWFAW